MRGERSRTSRVADRLGVCHNDVAADAESRLSVLCQLKGSKDAMNERGRNNVVTMVIARKHDSSDPQSSRVPCVVSALRVTGIAGASNLEGLLSLHVAPLPLQRPAVYLMMPCWVEGACKTQLQY